MNRRSLLKLLALGTIGHALDVEKLLWVPGQKAIFLPTPRQIAFLYGLPYHASDGTVGKWLGPERVIREQISESMLYSVIKEPK